MIATKFKTKNTVYEINETGVFRNGELEIKTENIVESFYYGTPKGGTQEAEVGAKLFVRFNIPEEDGSMDMRTTRIQEMLNG